MKKSSQSAHRSGVTLLEILVVTSIIAILASLLLPAVQQSREAARRMTCQSQLRQLITAAQNFESTYRKFPNGTSHKYELLPFLGETAVFEAGKTNGGEGNLFDDDPLKDTYLPYLICPSDPGATTGEGIFGTAFGTSYHGNAGTGVLADGFNGLFGYGADSNDIYPDKAVKTGDITDGLSNTAMFSEALLPNSRQPRVTSTWLTPTEYFDPEDLPVLASQCNSVPRNPQESGWEPTPFPRGFPWHGGGMGTALYTHTLPPNRPSCTNGSSVMTGIYTAASMHPGGVNVAFADGHIDFVSQDIDSNVWVELGSRAPSNYDFPFSSLERR